MKSIASFGNHAIGNEFEEKQQVTKFKISYVKHDGKISSLPYTYIDTLDEYKKKADNQHFNEMRTRCREQIAEYETGEDS